MRNQLHLLICATLLLPSAFAQSAGAPRLGWLADPALQQALAVDGVPGAARLAAPLALPAEVHLLATHPAHPGALAVVDTPDGPALAFHAFDAGPQASPAPLAAAPAFAVWSPSGAYALAAFPEEGLLRAYRFEAPASLTLSWELPAHASSAAVSDDGSAILALVEGALVLHTRSASTPIAEPGPDARFTFLAASAAFAYTQPDSVILHDGLASAPLPEAGPAAALLSPAPGRLLVLQAAEASSRLSLWSLQRDLLASADAPPATATLRSAGPSTVWLQAPSPGPDPSPQWFAHLSAAELRVFFVPPAEPLGGELQ